MVFQRKIILTKDLKLSDVPQENSDIEVINAFAITFEVKESIESGDVTMVNSTFDENSSLIELRAVLYVTQRAWNHFGRRYDSKTENKVREIIRLIRSKFK